MQKNAILPQRIIEDGDMSGNLISDTINVQRMDRAYIQLVFTGSPVGDFFVEASADHTEDPSGKELVDGTWIPLDLDPSPYAIGVADDIGIDLTVTAIPWIRVRYARTSGTGTLNTHLSGKES